MSGLVLTITAAGRAALVNAAHLGTLPVLMSSVGVSATAFSPTAATTSLPDEIKRLTTFAGDVVAEDTIHVTVRDESADLYTVRSLGLYLDNGTLFAVYSQSDPVMEKSAQALLLLALDVVFADIDAADITFGDTSFLNPPATTERQGVVELATPDEAKVGIDTMRAVTPKGLKAALDMRVVPATTEAAGIVELSTEDEAISGIDDQRALSPASGHAAIRAVALTLNETGSAYYSPRRLTLYRSGTGQDTHVEFRRDGADYYSIVSGAANTAAASLQFRRNNIDPPVMGLYDDLFLVGINKPVYSNVHHVTRSGVVGTPILAVVGRDAGRQAGAVFYVASSLTASSSATVLQLQRNETTLRSMNAGGSVNTNGADDAEYHYKAETCGVIAKGQVVGLSADLIVDRFDEASRFRIKSTEPGTVRGDRWGAVEIIGERPTPPAAIGPQPAPPGDEPAPPPEPERSLNEPEAQWAVRVQRYARAYVAWEEEHARWSDAAASYSERLADWLAAAASYQAALASYEAAMVAWEGRLEQERARVDRLAYDGRVPAIVSGPVVEGYKVIAQRNEDGGIEAVCVAEPTEAQRRCVVGVVSVAYPTEANLRQLLSPTVPINPAWTAIVVVGWD